MKGPYTWKVVLAETAETGAGRDKRDIIRDMRRSAKALGVSPDGEDKATGEVRDGSGQLVKQVIAYRSRWGNIRLRDLEL